MTNQDAAKKRHRFFAGWYPGRAVKMDRAGFAQYRIRLLAGLSGRVLELGAGSGQNFGYYPPQVEQVLAVEPEPRMRELARAAAAAVPVPVEVVDGAAEDLSAHAGGFDAAVCSLVLCSVPDQRAALEQLGSVLRPGGQLRVLEHVQADGGALAALQQTLDATIRPRLTGGLPLRSGRDAGGGCGRARAHFGARFPLAGQPVPVADRATCAVHRGARGARRHRGLRLSPRPRRSAPSSG